MERKVQSKSQHPVVVVLLLFLLFTLPFVAAWYLYRYHASAFHASTEGQLITPPFPITALVLRDAQGRVLDNRLLGAAEQSRSGPSTNRRWLLLYVHHDSMACDIDCQRDVGYLRRIQKAIGKDRERVGRVLLTYGSGSPQPAADSAPVGYWSDMRHLFVDRSQFERVTMRYLKTADAAQTRTVYLVDPLGNVILYYRSGTEPAHILADLQRLLEASQIG